MGVTMHVPGKQYTIAPLKIYPTLADEVRIDSDTSDWGQGAYTEIIPVDTITKDFYLMGIYVRIFGTVSRQWEVTLATGLAAAELDIAPFAGHWAYITAVGLAMDGQQVMLPLPILIPANTRISGIAADDNVAALQYRCKVFYSEGPL